MVIIIGAGESFGRENIPNYYGSYYPLYLWFESRMNITRTSGAVDTYEGTVILEVDEKEGQYCFLDYHKDLDVRSFNLFKAFFNDPYFYKYDAVYERTEEGDIRLRLLTKDVDRLYGYLSVLPVKMIDQKIIPLDNDTIELIATHPDAETVEFTLDTERMKANQTQSDDGAIYGLGFMKSSSGYGQSNSGITYIPYVITYWRLRNEK